MYGKGLNSIRIRFTLMIGVLVCLTAAGLAALDHAGHLGLLPVWTIAVLCVVAALLPAAITYLMAGKLTGLIAQLRQSTDAIAAGDFNAPVDVNCACEIGGLADSFRTMVRRLNSNILRMNVLAYSDRVTELPNRAVITHVLSRSLTATAAPPFSGAVMFIDLDRFKQVNDSLGHEAGDDLLRQASLRILTRGLNRTPDTIDNCMTAFGELCDRPPVDIVFVRFAGDEFVALLPNVSSRQALEKIADNIIAALDEPFRVSNTEVRIGASIGIACTPDDTRDPSELLNFADLAMYAAKEMGRNRFAFFDGTLREAALQRANIEKELRRAMLNDELVIHYQPKVSADGHQLRGLEALVRWQHPVRGLLMPKDFIAVAEQSGLIEELGCRVAHLAMRQAAEWRKAGHDFTISINVSSLQFRRPDFLSRVQLGLEHTGAPASSIELELTESVALSDLTHTMSNLQQLRALGFRIAIDDFGCGFSNLSQLAQLPFDTLKIDRSLVERIGTDSKAESVIKAIISMGRSLGHEVVAEGVETMKQLTFLQTNGCDVVQGFLFARAMAPESVPDWSRARAASPVAAQRDLISHHLLAG
jgi:two-component system CheB/CheR fusion protein